jgi:hypothetical protein
MASPPPKAPEAAKAKENQDSAHEEKMKSRRRVFAKFALARTTDGEGQDSCIPAALVPVALRQLGYFPPKKVSDDARNGATWTTFEKLCDKEDKRRQPTEADFVAALRTIAKAQRNKTGAESTSKDDSVQKESENEPTCVRLQVLKDALSSGPDALQGEELEFALTLAARGVIADNNAGGAAESDKDKENPLVSIDSFSKVLSNPPPPPEPESSQNGTAARSSSAASPGQAEENKNDQQRAESTGNGSGADGKKDESSKSDDQNGQATAGKENSNNNTSSSNSGNGGNGSGSQDQASQEQKSKDQNSSDSKSRSAPPPEKKEEEKKGCCVTM